MRNLLHKILIISLLLLVVWLINFRFENPEQAKPTQIVKKVVVVKKVYVKVPSPCPAQIKQDSVASKDSMIITMPKINTKPLDLKQFNRSRQIHKKAFVAILNG
jgi:hypothetical protein